jgi:diazepam-binding inhibitor (GABA receptor modulator, acyl-CoA-binding protein)
VDERTFEEAAARLKTLGDLDPEVLLEAYGLYKQATVGDPRGPRPGILDLRAQAKYDAWARWAGRTAAEARLEYVRLVRRLESDLSQPAA